MKQVPRWLMCVFGFLGAFVAAHASPVDGAPEIRISDVELFYRVYDAAKGTPSAQTLQIDYLDAGSDGLRQFIPNRIVSADKLAEAIGKKRETYEHARTCAAELPDVRSRLAASLKKLADIYPAAKFPPVTMLIGRGNTGGTPGKAGVLIGVETICAADWMQPDVGDRLVHLIAHEYAHVQQPIVERIEDPSDGTHTVLEVSLGEGIAELVAELTSGSVSNAHLQRYAAGREQEIERAFLADAEKTDLSAWLYNGRGTTDRPGDLGYWVGYRIARQFYESASDKRAAVRELVDMADAPDILKRSGWAERVRADWPMK
jgi:hypothetical protein